MMKTVVVLLLVPATVVLLLLLVFVVLFFLGFRFKPTVSVEELVQEFERQREREREQSSGERDLREDQPIGYDDGEEDVEWGGPGLPR